jgi:hypothetical protein
VAKPSWSAASDPWSRRDVHRLGRRFGSADRQTGRDVGARTTARRLPRSIVWRNGLVVMKWQPVRGLAELERTVRQSVYAFIATIATSVRFFAFSFLMTLRTWTFTVLKHIFNSLAIILFDLPCWIARTTESSRLVSM